MTTESIKKQKYIFQVLIRIFIFFNLNFLLRSYTDKILLLIYRNEMSGQNISQISHKLNYEDISKVLIQIIFQLSIIQ